MPGNMKSIAKYFEVHVIVKLHKKFKLYEKEREEWERESETAW